MAKTLWNSLQREFSRESLYSPLHLAVFASGIFEVAAIVGGMAGRLGWVTHTLLSILAVSLIGAGVFGALSKRAMTSSEKWRFSTCVAAVAGLCSFAMIALRCVLASVSAVSVFHMGKFFVDAGGALLVVMFLLIGVGGFLLNVIALFAGTRAFIELPMLLLPKEAVGPAQGASE